MPIPRLTPSEVKQRNALRKQRILAHVDQKGYGLEIGPCHRPVAPKREGFNVEILDHLSTNGLRNKYQGHQIDTTIIEEVDHIWDGGSYADTIGKRNCYDWIIASHLIEHTTDIVGFLKDCTSILKPDGVLSLVIPDKRYCFDLTRTLTGLGKVIDQHLAPPKVHTVGAVTEHTVHSARLDSDIAWSSEDRGKLQLPSNFEGAKAQALQVIENAIYFDVHAWVFTPSSFRLLIHDLFELDYITLREVGYCDTDRHEFYVSLSMNGDRKDGQRRSLIKKVFQEQIDGAQCALQQMES